jgi:hypothetical protein
MKKHSLLALAILVLANASFAMADPDPPQPIPRKSARRRSLETRSSFIRVLRWKRMPEAAAN